MKNYEKLISLLEELYGWLDKASAYGFTSELKAIISELKSGEITTTRRRLLKGMLSNELRFNGKAIYDVTVEGFSDRGQIVPWIDFVTEIQALAEETL